MATAEGSSAPECLGLAARARRFVRPGTQAPVPGPRGPERASFGGASSVPRSPAAGRHAPRAHCAIASPSRLQGASNGQKDREPDRPFCGQSSLSAGALIHGEKDAPLAVVFAVSIVGRDDGCHPGRHLNESVAASPAAARRPQLAALIRSQPRIASPDADRNHEVRRATPTWPAATLGTVLNVFGVRDPRKVRVSPRAQDAVGLAISGLERENARASVCLLMTARRWPPEALGTNGHCILGRTTAGAKSGVGASTY